MCHKLLRPIIGLAAFIALACNGTTGMAAEYATREEAIAFVKKAIVHYKTVGRIQALSDISAKDNKFTDRELYVTVMEIASGVATADSRYPRLVGKNLTTLKDADGKLFVKEQLYIGKMGSASWVDYRWPNPVSLVVESKTTYCEPHDGLIFCTGIYRGV